MAGTGLWATACWMSSCSAGTQAAVPPKSQVRLHGYSNAGPSGKFDALLQEAGVHDDTLSPKLLPDYRRKG